MRRQLITTKGLSRSEIEAVLDYAAEIAAEPSRFRDRHEGALLGLLFYTLLPTGNQQQNRCQTDPHEYYGVRWQEGECSAGVLESEIDECQAIPVEERRHYTFTLASNEDGRHQR
jgi:hypothetical protein